MRERINALHPSWTTTPHWSLREVEALHEAWPNLSGLQPQDWAVLGWLFHTFTSAAKQKKLDDPQRVTSKRQALLKHLPSYLARARELFEKHGKATRPKSPSSQTPARHPQRQGQESSQDQELPLEDRPEGGPAAAARLKALINAPSVPTKP